VRIGGDATGVLRSCDPSCAVSFQRGALYVHATRDVAAGDELSIAYVELYAAGVDRRAQLQTKKFFQWYSPNTPRRLSSPPLQRVG
jgi:SET domain-containing protein